MLSDDDKDKPGAETQINVNTRELITEMTSSYKSILQQLNEAHLRTGPSSSSVVDTDALRGLEAAGQLLS